MSRALLNFDSNVLKIIDTHDIFANRNQRFKKVGQTTGWFSTTVRQEVIGLKRADHIIAIQATEAEYFRRVQPKRVVVVGDIPEISSIKVGTVRQVLPGQILLVGSNNPSNRQGAKWFISYVMPALRQQVPEVSLVVVGGLSESIEVQPGVQALGVVDSLQAQYAQASVVINPALVGTGLKIKTVEALAYGKPLVTTSVGGEGLEDGWAKAFCIADSAEEFIAELATLLTDQETALALGKRARTYAEFAQEKALLSLAKVLQRDQ